MISASGGVSTAVAKKNRKKLEREIARDLRAKDRDKLAELHTAIARARSRRRSKMRQVVESCVAQRVAVRAHAKIAREQAREALREARRLETQAARTSCNVAKGKLRAAAAEEERNAKRAMSDELSLQREVRRADSRIKTKEHGRSTRKERAQESDDAVRHNIPADLVPLWNRIRSTIRGNERQSRTEAFLRYVEENPGEAIETQEELSSKYLRDLLKQERALVRKVRRPSGYRGLAAAPF